MLDLGANGLYVRVAGGDGVEEAFDWSGFFPSIFSSPCNRFKHEGTLSYSAMNREL